jgi:chromosome segregation ATPase
MRNCPVLTNSSIDFTDVSSPAALGSPPGERQENNMSDENEKLQQLRARLANVEQIIADYERQIADAKNMLRQYKIERMQLVDELHKAEKESRR